MSGRWKIKVDSTRKTLKWLRPAYSEHPYPLKRTERERKVSGVYEGYRWVDDCTVCGKEYERRPEQRRPICGNVKCKIEFTKLKPKEEK